MDRGRYGTLPTVDLNDQRDFVSGRAGAGIVLSVLIGLTVVAFALEAAAIFVGAQCGCSVAALLLVYGVGIYATFVYTAAIGATLFGHYHHFRWRQWLLYGSGVSSLFSVSLVFALVTLLIAAIGPTICEGTTGLSIALAVVAILVFLLVFILYFGGFMRTHPGTHRQMFTANGQSQHNYLIAKRFEHIVPRHAVSGAGTWGKIMLGVIVFFALLVIVLAAIAFGTADTTAADLSVDAQTEEQLWLGLSIHLAVWLLLAAVFVWATARNFFNMYWFLSRPTLVVLVIGTFVSLVGVIVAVAAVIRCLQTGYFIAIAIFFLLLLAAHIWLWAIVQKITEATPEFKTVRDHVVSGLARQ